MARATGTHTLNQTVRAQWVGETLGLERTQYSHGAIWEARGDTSNRALHFANTALRASGSCTRTSYFSRARTNGNGPHDLDPSITEGPKMPCLG